ncbi:MAG: GTP 3',8-cyclase MoaA [Cryobacterium sp.]|nr:GTP 3',8-cyclase MoaA [Oligoflexia bacterium]
MATQLVDAHGRRVRKLRLSLTDKCNLRCHYCMPLDATFMSEAKYLQPAEYFEVVSELCEVGLEELRLTGGEPLMRKSFDEIALLLSRLPLKKIGLTTNAVLLDRHLDVLKQARVEHLNISLDSLDATTFHKVTHGNHLARVLKNIELAKKAGFSVKINVVAMRGVNDHEVFDFAEYARNLDVEVRFLELMRIGHALEKQSSQFISAAELMKNLGTRYQLTREVTSLDSTSFNFRLSNGARIGFIASESKAFCGQCSRWRLSADGIMRACLFKDDGLSIRSTTSGERGALYRTLLGMKPFLRPAEVIHPMNAIGG